MCGKCFSFSADYHTACSLLLGVHALKPFDICTDALIVVESRAEPNTGDIYSIMSVYESRICSSHISTSFVNFDS